MMRIRAFCQEVQAPVFGGSRNPNTALEIIDNMKRYDATHSMNHSSPLAGEVLRFDHASAVTRTPT
jgi:hypothetical protein